ncbi:MAG TPA: 23S rRNA (adenine(2503)-C(2))-methyltransferase RlmN [Elusimicrobia bacterium]|nr:MAG: 23S rRNA (adenine(2503)-C(2))-methyltransferase [Elusimicrobia bacterium GWF2_62_30]HBA59533.1 23S rRNA (adenine(2503)-C(2))-methyltransferase RlmN [Elusimicrobiota bacterium]
MKPDIRDFTRAELEEELLSLGLKATHAGRVFECLYKQGITDFEEMAEVPPKVRAALAGKYSLCPFPPAEKRVSLLDGTQKLLFRFHGGAPAESVILPGKGRLSACLSSQAGCACGCTFCATGALGLKRDLRPSEITAQFAACLREAGGSLSSLVFMGMGEPFLNWENVKKAILILSDGRSWNYSQGKMTVSTVGIVPVINELATSTLKVKLAISVVAADEVLRAKLVPMQAKYPLSEVIAAARSYCRARKAQVFFEYIVFTGVNDSAADAEKLIRLIKGIDCRVNLIPHNSPAGRTGDGEPSVKTKAFQKQLIAAGLRTYLRLEKGSDILAACGQLAAKLP